MKGLAREGEAGRVSGTFGAGDVGRPFGKSWRESSGVTSGKKERGDAGDAGSPGTGDTGLARGKPPNGGCVENGGGRE